MINPVCMKCYKVLDQKEIEQYGYYCQKCEGKIVDKLMYQDKIRLLTKDNESLRKRNRAYEDTIRLVIDHTSDENMKELLKGILELAGVDVE